MPLGTGKLECIFCKASLGYHDGGNYTGIRITNGAVLVRESVCVSKKCGIDVGHRAVTGVLISLSSIFNTEARST